MSADFPNREDWLAVRSTPRKLDLGHYIHVSAELYWYKDAAGNPHTGVKRGLTYHANRRYEKTITWMKKEVRKRLRHRMKCALKNTGVTAGIASHT